jgi:predicted O-linked N-acetylglucosamine transferase (SPINDLY family)
MANPSHAASHFNLGNALHVQGRLLEAVTAYRQALSLQPNFPEALNNLGLAQAKLGLLHEARAAYEQALSLRPSFAEAYNNLGNTLHNLGCFDAALGSFQQALALKPNYTEAHNNLGYTLQSQGRLEEAMAAYRQALSLSPNFAQAHYNLGNAFQSLDRLDEAVASYRQALALDPNLVGAHYNLGNALQSRGDLDAAIALYQHALALNPNFAGAHNNLGGALQSLGRFEEAVASFRRALELSLNFGEAYNNLGLTLAEMERFDEAVVCFRRVLELIPDFPEGHSNLAGGLREQGKLLEAVECYRQAVQLAPSNPVILSQYVSLLQQLCIWDNLEDLAQRVMETVALQALRGGTAAVDPFLFMTLPIITAVDQHAVFQCAQRWAEQRSKSASQQTLERRQPGSRLDSGKIVVGYLSVDYHEHPVAHLIPELIEKHDRQRFKVLGYSYGPNDGSAIRHRLERAFDEFVDVNAASFQDTARRIQSDKVDILVDLTGYTGKARSQILALRPAPIQVNYLGYPGTMAASCMDYIMIDEFVVPPEQERFFSEKLVRLPGAYQVNDSQRPIAAHTPSRADCGLPETGFVFCCFNSTYKITPRMFDVWMRLLQANPGSVLWLLENNPFVPANLRKEAQARGVPAERLIFAPRLPLAEHLARHRLADLFLDTLPYNAHTTASDALWAGCPLLTITEETFPSRVAASLLRTVGLPELITTTIPDYEELALRLAQDSEYLETLRNKLDVNRKSSRLFDGGLAARDIEKAYLKMWQIYLVGEQPRAFTVAQEP